VAVLSGKRKLPAYLACGGKYALNGVSIGPVDEPEGDTIALKNEATGDIWAYDWSAPVDNLTFSIAVAARVARPAGRWRGLSVLDLLDFVDGLEVGRANNEGDPILAFNVTQRSERPFSPLFAAAMGVLPKPQSQPVSRSASEELRGRLETLLAQALE